jgi:hypothetical protein
LYKFTKVTLPNTITKIGNNAFQGCTSLAQINIPESVKTIGNSVFQSCTSLTAVKIPNSVTEIGYNVFADCTSLSSVNIPDSITTINQYTFKNCPIESIEIPKGVTIIYSAAFYGTKLKTIVIPESVSDIRSTCFKDCKNLETVIFGTKEYSQQVTLAASMFAGDSALTDIYCYNTTVPTMNNENVFDADTYNTACLHVPASVTAAYQKADYWKNFTNYGTMTAISSVESDDNQPIEYYTLSGIKLSGKPSIAGIYITKQGGKVSKIAIR